MNVVLVYINGMTYCQAHPPLPCKPNHACITCSSHGPLPGLSRQQRCQPPAAAGARSRGPDGTATAVAQNQNAPVLQHEPSLAVPLCVSVGGPAGNLAICRIEHKIAIILHNPQMNRSGCAQHSCCQRRWAVKIANVRAGAHADSCLQLMQVSNRCYGHGKTPH